jgi:hypothetical protein
MPLGPKPVSNLTGTFGDSWKRLRNFCASLKGQDLYVGVVISFYLINTLNIALISLDFFF